MWSKKLLIILSFLSALFVLIGCGDKRVVYSHIYKVEGAISGTTFVCGNQDTTFVYHDGGIWDEKKGELIIEINEVLIFGGGKHAQITIYIMLSTMNCIVITSIPVSQNCYRTDTMY